MIVRFWGVRGSIAAPQTSEEFQKKLIEILKRASEKKLKSTADIQKFINSLPFCLKNNYGGNTTCIEIEDNKGNLFILDAGTGIRLFGEDYLNRKVKSKNIHIFLSHFHWDHIQGFPFFLPAYLPELNITFYSTKRNLHKLFKQQQNKDYFPKKLSDMESKKKFVHCKPGKPIKIDDTTIDCFKMNHPGGDTAYSFVNKNKKVTFTGDVELTEEDIENIDKFGDFFMNSNVAVFDSQYTLKESFSKFDWGHTSYTMAVNFGVNWKIKNVLLTHFDQTYSDETIMQIEKWAIEHLENYKNSKVKVSAAYEGLELKV